MAVERSKMLAFKNALDEFQGTSMRAGSGIETLDAFGAARNKLVDAVLDLLEFDRAELAKVLGRE